MLSCTISRRRLVQRWPAVPTALKTTARTARSRSALGATTMPLLPPSSSSERPSRAAISGESALPMAVEPVADTSGRRGSSASCRARSAPPITTSSSPSGASPNAAAARRKSAWHASAVSGVRSLGFHTTGSPHTSASAAFQLHTATGKLNARDHADRAERVPGLEHAMAGALGGDRTAEELAREPHGEVADVDHLLHLAEALLGDLAGLERDELAERLLLASQLLAEQADELAAPRCGHVAPRLEGFGGSRDCGIGTGRIGATAGVRGPRR